MKELLRHSYLFSFIVRFDSVEWSFDWLCPKDHPNFLPSLQELQVAFYLDCWSTLQKFRRGLMKTFSRPRFYVLALAHLTFLLMKFSVTLALIFIFICVIVQLWPWALRLCFSGQNLFLIFITTFFELPVAQGFHQPVLPDQNHPHQNYFLLLFHPIQQPLLSSYLYQLLPWFLVQVF